MAKDENKSSRRKSNRERAKRRKELVREERKDDQASGRFPLGIKWGKQFLLTGLFATAVIFICFVGQDPPSLRTLGEVAPENVYSDREFKYLSEVRRIEAEEWIRSSTPREFAQNFAGEEAYSKALIRLQEGLLTIDSMPLESLEQASLNLINELESNFKLSIEMDEFSWLQKWQNFPSVRIYSPQSCKNLGHCT